MVGKVYAVMKGLIIMRVGIYASYKYMEKQYKKISIWYSIV